MQTIVVFSSAVQQSIASGNPLRFFYLFQKKDGSYTIFESHGHIYVSPYSESLGAGGNNGCGVTRKGMVHFGVPPLYLINKKRNIAIHISALISLYLPNNKQSSPFVVMFFATSGARLAYWSTCLRCTTNTRRTLRESINDHPTNL